MMRSRARPVLSLLSPVLLLSAAGLAPAEVSLPKIFGDRMVLQRDLAVPVWGAAAPGEAVTVEFAGQKKETKADAGGAWRIRLDPMSASGEGRAMTVTGLVDGKSSVRTFADVLVGDVWLCSGQSNMEWTLGGCNAPDDIAAADLPKIRRFKLPHLTAGRPKTDAPGEWQTCTPQTAPGITAVGFYFARRIQKETGLPIGLLDINWGGTRIEPWITRDGFGLVPGLSGILPDLEKRHQDYRQRLGGAIDAVEKWIPAARQALAANGDIPPAPGLPGDPMLDAGQPMAICHAMIHPVAPCGLKGALWYQGESNGGEGEEYFWKMQALVGGWRQLWGQGDFPFYFVQLAAFQQPNPDPAGGDGWARVRMAQMKSMTIPNSGMAVATDIGEANDIHPKNKFDVGERLARWALNRDYGKKEIVPSGPVYKSMAVEEGRIRVAFDYVGAGLMVGKKTGREPAVEDAAGKLARFAVAGEDRKWVWADAVVDKDTVVVSSPQVPKPVAVRFAFSMNPEGANLYNRDGLPASPFRTDEW